MGIEGCDFGSAGPDDGVFVGDGEAVIEGVISALLHHRFPERDVASVPA